MAGDGMTAKIASSEDATLTFRECGWAELMEEGVVGGRVRDLVILCRYVC